MTTTLVLPRYKYGYVSDEWGMNRSLGLIPDPAGNVCKVSDALAAIAALERDMDEMRQTMAAAAEEIHEHWQAHCDAEGYGPANLQHRLEGRYGVNYPSYTLGAFQKLKAERDAAIAATEAAQAAQPASCFLCNGTGFHEPNHAYSPGMPPPTGKVACSQCKNKPSAKAAQPTESERWFKWQGDYEKQSYDVWISGSDVVLGCWPNAGYMAATDGSGRQWLPGAVLAVRVSAYQGRFPKPKFDAAIAASKGAA